jgi:hypothetical protein
MKTRKLWLPMLAVVYALFYTGCENPPPPCADLIISSISVPPYITGNTFDYSITFQNIGTGSTYIDGNNTHVNIPGYQAYRSTNSVLDPSDPPAGGNTIAGGPSFTLDPGATYVRSARYNPSTPLPLAQYPYLIVVVRPGTAQDCNANNNTFVKYLFLELAP